MARQSDPETERKRAWLNRYRESLAEQRRMMEQLEEARARSTSICVSLNPVRSAPTGTHSDRERRRVQLIARAASKLENGELLNLAETAVMADSVGMSYGYYSHHLSAQNSTRKHKVC